MACAILTLSSLLPETKNSFTRGLYLSKGNLMDEREGPGLAALEEPAFFHTSPTLVANLAAVPPDLVNCS